MLIIICGLLTTGYALLLMAYKKGWALQENFSVQAGYTPHTLISVIIPARNEAANIGACIDAILAQKYPDDLFEIIIVDDHSDDNTVNIVQGYSINKIRCIKLSDTIDSNARINAFKKAALAAGITQSRGELIVTTDADCIAPHSWLLHIAALYEQQQAAMIVAPVIYATDHSLIQIFQLIDFMSMQGITAAAHRLRLGNMSNGANLAFQKTAYEAVGGYEGISHLASGDDYLLMMKINKAFPEGIAYLKSVNAIVSTAPQPDWKSFLQQRIRWASKSGKYNDSPLTGILILVYLFNLSFVALLCAGIFHPLYFYLLAGMLVIKITAEYLFLKPVAHFFNKAWPLKYLPFLQPLHILYIVLAGLLGFMGGYEWKGRKVK